MQNTRMYFAKLVYNKINPFYLSNQIGEQFLICVEIKKRIIAQVLTKLAEIGMCYIILNCGILVILC